MPGHARTLLTRVLPWAALVLITSMFFVQLSARKQAENRAREVEGTLHAERADRVMGMGPAAADTPQPVRPAAPAAAPARDYEAELGRMRIRVESLQEQLAGAQEAHRVALTAVERAQALRATEAARAGALTGDLESRREQADQRVRELEAQLAEARAALERRRSPVARWLSLVEGGTPRALELVGLEAAKATAEDVAELRERWEAGGPEGGPGPLTVAAVLGPVPPGTASAELAADLLLATESAQRSRRLIERLALHLVRAEAVARVIERGSNEHRSDLLAHAAARKPTWDDAQQALVGAALAGQLASDDAWTLELTIRAFAQLGIGGHESKLLRFLTHEAPTVRIATVYALLATSDRKSAIATLTPTVVALLDDKAFDVRMAGLFLAQELAGEKRSLAFGSSDQAVAKEVARLKARLAELAK